MKRRSAIEPTTLHMKCRRRLDRNRLKGALGDHVNVMLSAAGMNFHKILKTLANMPDSLALFWAWLLELLRPRPATPAISGAR